MPRKDGETRITACTFLHQSSLEATSMTALQCSDYCTFLSMSLRVRTHFDWIIVSSVYIIPGSSILDAVAVRSRQSGHSFLNAQLPCLWRLSWLACERLPAEFRRKRWSQWERSSRKYLETDTGSVRGSAVALPMLQSWEGSPVCSRKVVVEVLVSYLTFICFWSADVS